MATGLTVLLKSVELRNFRCFDEISVSFQPDLTVLIGFNGAGKTALIEAVAGLLQPLVSKIKSEAVSDRIDGFGERDIKNGTLQAINTLRIEVTSTHESGPPEEPVTLEWYGTLDKEGYQTEELSNLEDFVQLDNAMRAVNLALRENQPVNLPVLVYYPCTEAGNRENGLSSSRITIFGAYENALNNHSFDFAAFERWFKWQEKIAQETKDERLLTHIKNAVLSAISGNGRQYDKLFTRYLDSPEGELMLQSREGLVYANQLSSGERMLFGIVGDLARRLILLNPQSDAPLSGGGIVLIDEIDLHLHPKWQKRIIDVLRETFPYIQFVLTTHSPLVLQDVPSTNILILDNQEVLSADDTLGQEVAVILKKTMDTESDPYEEEIRAVFRDIAANELAKAKEKISALELKIEGRSPRLEQAKAAIKRKELLST